MTVVLNYFYLVLEWISAAVNLEDWKCSYL